MNAVFEAVFGIGIIVAGGRIVLDRPTVHTADVLFGRYFGLGFVIAGAICTCYGVVRLTQLRRERRIRSAAGLDARDPDEATQLQQAASDRRTRWPKVRQFIAGIGLAAAVCCCVLAVATAPIRHEALDTVARFAAAIPALGGFAALILSRATGWTWSAAVLGAGAVVPVTLPVTWFGICVSAILGAGAVIALIGDACMSTRSAEDRVEPAKEDVRTGSAGSDRETEPDDRKVENSSTE